VADLTAASTALSAGEYGTAATDAYAGSVLIFDLPAQELFIGGLEAPGL
jgi:hypothetical protein